MNDAFHTDPYSSSMGDVGVNMPEFWGASLAFRIWLWLSQIYALHLRARPAPLAQRLLRSTQLQDPFTPFQAAQKKTTANPVCGCEACACRTSTTKAASASFPSRHTRRLGARQRRGILPVGRYSVHFLRRYFAAGMTQKAALHYARRLSHILGVKDFVRFCPRFLSLVTDRVAQQISVRCGAPLSPD